MTNYRDRTAIKDMKLGECGFTKPWAVSVFEGVLYLHGDYTIRSDTGGTTTLFVIKYKDGFHIDRAAYEAYEAEVLAVKEAASTPKISSHIGQPWKPGPTDFKVVALF